MTTHLVNWLGSNRLCPAIRNEGMVRLVTILLTVRMLMLKIAATSGTVIRAVQDSSADNRSNIVVIRWAHHFFPRVRIRSCPRMLHISHAPKMTLRLTENTTTNNRACRMSVMWSHRPIRVPCPMYQNQRMRENRVDVPASLGCPYPEFHWRLQPQS